MTGSFSLTLPPDLAYVSDARRLMEEVGAATGLSEDRVFDLKVAVSEACANAIEHARGGVDVLARLVPGRIIIEISNPGEFLPGLSVGSGRRRGLGLPLMASLADRVQISRLPEGRTQVCLTFFTVSTTGSEAAGPTTPDMDPACRPRPDTAARGFRELAGVVERITASRSFKEACDGLIDWAQELTGCDAAILRLTQPEGQVDGWIPALAHRGLSPQFLRDEALIGADECMCGRVCRGVTDPKLPFFTGGGSFLWGRAQSIGREFSSEVLGSVRGRCIAEGYESVAIFPLMREREPLGSLHLADFDSEKFSPYEELMEAACRICGPLLARHRDDDFERATVAAVESALLPREVPQVKGLDLAVAFTSATEGARVGGDFYDVIELDPGVTLILVGDCTGNGIEVAGVAARVRGALASLSQYGSDPGELLGRANRVLRNILPPGRLVTMVVSCLSREGKLVVASAGHPRPLRLDPQGRTKEIVLPPNAPLGAFEGVSFATATHELSPGQTLVLFTDGISDSRRGEEFFGTEGIARVWDETRTRPLAEFADAVCRECESFQSNGHSRDDRLVLAARLAG
jgi:serine phosphatase RsbU (regulator of sigma subunit)/anti-sigma regulatory factor (Ser/Thr protein kinase)